MRRPSIRKPSLSRLSILKPSRRPPLRIIAIAVVAIAAIVLLLRACGGDDDREVRRTVERFGQASRDKDYQALCDELLSKKVVEQARSAGQPCEVALQIGLGDVRNPTLKVRSVEIDGDEALARVDSKAVGQRPSQDTVKLVREDGDWRIKDLADEAAAGAKP